MQQDWQQHSWDIQPREAISLQKQLATQVTSKALTKKVNYVAGVDCAFTQDKNFCIAGAVIWDINKQEIIEKQYAKVKLTLPYIPGLLSFREAPAMLAALSKLTKQPDVLIVDGHGIAHPRRLGIASHIGILTKFPSFGCAKKRFVGNYTEPNIQQWSCSPLLDKEEQIGLVVRTRAKVKPVFISIGNYIKLENCLEILKQCSTGFRLPEPTRQADKYVAEIKKII